MKSFKEYGPSYNREHSNGLLVSELFGIDIKTLDDGGLQLFQIGLIQKNLGIHRYGAL